MRKGKCCVEQKLGRHSPGHRGTEQQITVDGCMDRVGWSQDYSTLQAILQRGNTL